MNKATLIIALAALAMLFPLSGKAQQLVNDINTPLHEMKPDYDTPYRVPSVDSIKADIDRVLSFLLTAMPAEADGDKLRQGGFRLTSYEMGVLYSACLDAAAVTDDKRYEDFTGKRLALIAAVAPKLRDKLAKDRHYDRQMYPVLFPHALDDCGAMCSAYCLLSMRRGTSAYDAVIDNYMRQVWRQFRLGPDSVFARMRPDKNSVWLDDMYMGIVPLAWYGCMKDDAASIRQAVAQIHAFERRMWMPEKQLFRHGWIEAMNPHPSFFWGRCNGWAVLTMCQVLDAMGRRHEALTMAGKADYDGYEADSTYVVGLLKKHIDGLVALQDKTGFWHQLLDDPSTYLETSATTIYAYCIAHAICEGWIDAKAYGPRALLAWNAAATQITRQGQVANVCVGTGMGFDKAFYAYRPTHLMAAHGYGPMIWAGSEIIRLLNLFHPKFNDSAILFYE